MEGCPSWVWPHTASRMSAVGFLGQCGLVALANGSGYGRVEDEEEEEYCAGVMPDEEVIVHFRVTATTS